MTMDLEYARRFVYAVEYGHLRRAAGTAGTALRDERRHLLREDVPDVGMSVNCVEDDVHVVERETPDAATSMTCAPHRNSQW